MHRTLAALEEIARADATGAESFDLLKLIRNVVLDCDVGSGLPVEVHPGTPLKVSGRRGAVSVIIRNALMNAVEAIDHTGIMHGLAVTITYGCTDRHAWVAVMDDGDGLPADLDPFVRGATRKTGHDGVGLTLAQTAAARLGGTLTLTNLADRGAQLRLEWPQLSEGK